MQLKNASHRSAICHEGDSQPELARQAWRDAINYLKEADDIPINGSNHIFTELQKSYGQLANYEIGMGEFENALALIKERVKHAQKDPDSLVDCASQFSDLAAAVKEDRSSLTAEEREAKAHECMDDAFEAVRNALNGGYSDLARLGRIFIWRQFAVPGSTER